MGQDCLLIVTSLRACLVKCMAQRRPVMQTSCRKEAAHANQMNKKFSKGSIYTNRRSMSEGEPELGSLEGALPTPGNSAPPPSPSSLLLGLPTTELHQKPEGSEPSEQVKSTLVSSPGHTPGREGRHWLGGASRRHTVQSSVRIC